MPYRLALVATDRKFYEKTIRQRALTELERQTGVKGWTVRRLELAEVNQYDRPEPWLPVYIYILGISNPAYDLKRYEEKHGEDFLEKEAKDYYINQLAKELNNEKNA